MRVLFFQSGTIWVHTLPEGFLEAGHEVKITGPLNLPYKDANKVYSSAAIMLGLQNLRNELMRF